MEAQVIKKVDGIILWVDERVMLRSVGRRIEISRDHGASFSVVGKLDLGVLRNFGSINRLGSRLLRANVKHLVRLTDSIFLGFAGRQIFRLNIETFELTNCSDIRGSRPLRTCVDGHFLYYGEYRSNPDRSPIRVWGSDDFGRTWGVATEFLSVRHVHAVLKDPFEDGFWVTTGDTDEEAAIWRFDRDWKCGEKIVSGSQQARVIDLLFSRDSVYFGTDAPEEQNWIVRLDRRSMKLEKIAPVDGTVFHAKAIEDRYFFSTACEPSDFNQSRRSDLICLQNGEAKTLISLEKDHWHMKYFQYGQITFSSGPGSLGSLWVSPLATQFDQSSLMLELSSNAEMS
jgi:hypothetical protein